MAEMTVTTIALEPPFARRSIPPKPLVLSASQTSLANANGVDIDQQPVLDSAISIPLTPLDSLPTIAGSSDDIYLANDDIAKFLKDDLDLSRLNRIHGHLWMAGRPMRARPLHRYKMMGFQIIHTQQMDLHLLKFSNSLMLKPLAEYMLSYDFWFDNICTDKTLHESACGFLLSYVWLLTTPLDLKIAHEIWLLPSFITWHWWKSFVKDFVAHVDPNTLDQVNKRYHFGDLRLGRINSIYRTRFALTHFVRGYLYGYNRYAVFFQRNFSWILIVFVFFSLVLAAMQVGASVEPSNANKPFLKTCYIFVVFSMVSVAAVLGLVGLIFVTIYLFNMVAAISHAKKKQVERKRKALEKRDKEA
ncbi:hypothetical protein K458DRAFT_142685 [Lentithecium fluviatile CBS 122367]|uniref:Uncharacterized protein n=1 Tax=Lentithecium fluviatile CBS 122367 TaxID=1168545 RepID=A0A6G1IJ04_9PLEO|nr:hypothetical protein K458DRAFT_142685 [Lentithecium fluviatile CBS 122367]